MLLVRAQRTYGTGVSTADYIQGRLQPPAAAPSTGERIEVLAQFGDVVIEQILSGVLHEPVDYDQAHDEWVALLAGGAVLEVGNERLTLETGDWLFLPARVAHRLVETRPGTSWLALHCLPKAVDSPGGDVGG